MADFTKTQGTFLDWTALGDTVTDLPFVDSGTLTIPAGALSTTLHITVAHTDINAAATNYVYVKVYVRTGANDEDWRLSASLQAGGGTAVLEPVADTSGAGEANPERLQVADTTDWDTGAQERIFVMDTTLANSEVVTIVGWADNDYYVCADGMTLAHANTADALSGVDGLNILLPDGADYCKVVFTNSDDDANYAVKIDYTSVTDIE